MHAVIPLLKTHVESVQGPPRKREEQQAALEVVAALLDALERLDGAAEHVAAANAKGSTALHLVALVWVLWSELREELAKRLLALAAATDIDARAWHGQTALHFAADSRSPFAALLVKNGADVK